MPNSIALTIIPDGPIKIENASKVAYCGQPLSTDGDIYLCRCGQSANAPFCDGTHSREGFVGSSEPKATKDIKVWEGNSLRTFFNPNTCMHAFYCKPLKSLREQELTGDDAAAAEIMRVIGTCPSGALTFESKAEVDEPTLPATSVEVDIVEGGEVRVQCAFEINAPLPERMHPDRATLCRCGLSQSKPWCDGRHKKKEGFR